MASMSMMAMRIAANIENLRVTAVVVCIVQVANTVMVMEMSVAGVDHRNEVVGAFTALAEKIIINYLKTTLRRIFMSFIKSIYFYLIVSVVCTVFFSILDSALSFNSSSVVSTFNQVSLWTLMGRAALLRFLVKQPVYNAWRE